MEQQKKFVVSVEKDSDGTYVAYNMDFSDYTLLGRGNTVAEAKADFCNSMEEVAGLIRSEGREIPEEFVAPPVFKFDLSSLFEYYSMINVSAFARYVGINAALMRQYRQGNTYVSDRQLKKIEDAIHRLGSELSSLTLI